MSCIPSPNYSKFLVLLHMLGLGGDGLGAIACTYIFCSPSWQGCRMSHAAACSVTYVALAGLLLMVAVSTSITMVMPLPRLTLVVSAGITLVVPLHSLA